DADRNCPGNTGASGSITVPAPPPSREKTWRSPLALELDAATTCVPALSVTNEPAAPGIDRRGAHRLEIENDAGAGTGSGGAPASPASPPPPASPASPASPAPASGAGGIAQYCTTA